MSQIFCVTSTAPIGCTFLDWSIHWLSGQAKFFNVDLGWIDLTDNPVQKINAHGHQRNIPAGMEQSIRVLDQLKATEGNLLSFYTCPMWADSAAHALQLDIKQIAEENSTVFRRIKKYIIDDYNRLVNYCMNNDIPVVYVNNDSHSVYNMFIRSIDRMVFENKPATEESLREEFLTVFFSESNQLKWGDTFKKLPIWDQREFIALNIRPYEKLNINPDIKIDFFKKHFYLSAIDLWINGESKILEILKYLNLELDTNRYQSWVSVYRTWQKSHLKILHFCWNLDRICDSIVNNYYFDLEPFKMDLWQEAIIQHILIYKHQLNLKTWQLTKFPTNAQDLHKLLEPNFHPVEVIY